MADRAENDERVDLDEDEYVEEIDEEVEEQYEDDGEEDAGDNSGEENIEEEYEDSKNEDNHNDESPDGDQNHNDNKRMEDEEKSSASADEEVKKKHAELLALPPHGSEVFIGGLPKDMSEDELRDVCESIGDVFEIRLVKDKDTGESKGFAFVSYKSKEVAQRAIEELHNKDIKGKTIRCSLAESKNRLFIGNVPKSLTEDEFRKFIEDVGPGIELIELMKDTQAPNRNRGFAFILYYNHACADYSRQKMLSPSFKLDGNTPTVTWADPKSTPDQSASAAAAQVKALYVKNIPENTSTEKLKELFQRHGEVTKVVMPPGKTGKRDFGFVHYAERSSALKAVRDTEKYEIDGQVLEVVLAKPQTEKKADASYPLGVALPPTVPFPAYGAFPGNPYGSLAGGFGVATSFQQPMIYGRGPTPSGMQMVPMVLPDGQIGYVLQQPGMQMPMHRPRRVDRGSGPGRPGRGRPGSSGDDGGRGRRYRPY